MPIYKVNTQLSTGRLSTGDTAVVQDQHQHQQQQQSMTYVELPESERYPRQGSSPDQKGDGVRRSADYSTQRVAFDQPESDKAESATDFIEREILEQREREKEVQRLRALAASPPPSHDEHQHAAQEYNNAGLDHVIITESAPPKLIGSGNAKHPDVNNNKNNNDNRSSDNDNNRGNNYDDDDDYDQQFAHPGESLIVRELLEQQRREEELRKHWQEMGFEMVDDHRADDDDDDDEEGRGRRVEEGERGRKRDDDRSDTNDHHNQQHQPPQQRHDDGQKDAKSHKQEHPVAAAAVHVDVSHHQQLQVTAPAPAAAVVADKVESRHHKDLHVDIEIAQPHPPASRTSSNELPPETPSRKKILLPLESAAARDDDDDTKSYLQPQAERTLEREIRAAREREVELRAARGLPSTSHDEARRSTSVEVEVVKVPRIDATDGATGRSAVRPLTADGGLPAADAQAPEYREFTKRYAESRLKVELQKERQRELDLRQSGVIHTISEERAGEHTKFVEVFSSPEDRAAKMEMSWRHRRSADPDLGSKSAGAGSAAAAQLPPVPATAPVKSTTLQQEKQQPAPQLYASFHREMPAVLKTYAYPYCVTESTSVVTADTLLTSAGGRRGVGHSGVNLIEEEVEELRRREEELRQLRESLRREHPELSADHHDDGHHGGGHQPLASTHRHDDDDDDRRQHHQEPEVVRERISLPADVTSVGGRHRLALIAEWEKRAV